MRVFFEFLSKNSSIDTCPALHLVSVVPKPRTHFCEFSTKKYHYLYPISTCSLPVGNHCYNPVFSTGFRHYSRVRSILSRRARTIEIISRNIFAAPTPSVYSRFTLSVVVYIVLRKPFRQSYENSHATIS